MSHPPIIWSIAGLDTAGGAGLSADQRAADAMGVHCCPVVAALTAQHSRGVEAIFPVTAEQLHAQLLALESDLPPRVIKTGLLGSVHAIEALVRWVDHFRAHTPAGDDPHRQLALVVDPVLGASAGGSAFSNEAVLQAYRDLVLPRTTVLTPNRAEAARLLGRPGKHDQPHDEIPELASALQGLGVRTVVVTGGDAPDAAHSLDWLASPQAQGWLAAPRVDTRHHHGTGCTFASGVASALALGHVEADAVVLAKMLTHHALMHAHAAGSGPGPVMARPGFAAGLHAGGAPLPWLGLGTELPWLLQAAQPTRFQPYTPPADGLYGILATSTQLDAALQAGLRCLQLRHKAAAGVEPHIDASLAAAARHGAQVFINDHWQLALSRPAPGGSLAGFQWGLHLGQEDLLALSTADQALLRQAADRVMLGLSSHSLWELARAAGCGASYIACGPVKATTTKDMPWLPQGPDNLRWWVQQAPVPVVAIGGLLTPAELQMAAACGPAAVCVVRGLGTELPDMQARLPALLDAVCNGRSQGDDDASTVTSLPHPVLPFANPIA